MSLRRHAQNRESLQAANWKDLNLWQRKLKLIQSMGLSIQLTDQTPWDTENLASCIAGPNKHYAKLREP